MSISVREIVENYLREHGYTGLCNYECGCPLGGLMPCYDLNIEECCAGYANDCENCAVRESEEGCMYYDAEYDVLYRTKKCFVPKEAAND